MKYKCIFFCSLVTLTPRSLRLWVLGFSVVKFLPAFSDPDPREDPTSRSLNGGSYKVPLVGPKLGDLLFRSSRYPKPSNPLRGDPLRNPKVMATYIKSLTLRLKIA